VSSASLAAALREVITTSELGAAQGAPDYRAETEALGRLVATLDSDPLAVPQRMVETAMALTGAGSAGISLEDTQDGEPVFRWVATTGEFARYLGGTMPRHFSPCGTVLESGAPQLMRDPVRAYPYIGQLHLPPRIVLLVPFSIGGRMSGTVWIVDHTGQKTFTTEDLRIVQSLAAFASAVARTVGLVRGLEAEAVRAQQQLARSELERLRLQQWFAQAPGFVALLRGRDFVIELANEAYLQLVGVRDVVGRPLFDAVPGVRQQGLEERLTRVFDTGTPYVGRGVKFELPDGQGGRKIRYVDVVNQPMLDAQGRVEGIFVQGQDTTEQHEAMRALREADRRKDDFLAVLSHELRNPLSPIQVSAHILQARLDGRDPVVHRAVTAIVNQAAALARLVDDLLDVARIRTGKVSLRMARIQLQDVVAHAIEVAEPVVKGKRQLLRVDVPEAPVLVTADASRLAQVISNLLLNAAKHSPDGARIELRLAAGTAGTVVEVRDDGPGIDPELLPHVFDMFTQAHGGSAGGLGIGLALVKRLVELHGGSVEASSGGPGHGSTFTIRLPQGLPASTADLPEPGARDWKDKVLGFDGASVEAPRTKSPEKI
jgi:PAS domain S-box-containing protein